jgi:hypothetical protein
MENAQTQEEAGVLHEKDKKKGSICSIECPNLGNMVELLTVCVNGLLECKVHPWGQFWQSQRSKEWLIRSLSPVPYPAI